jgi:hypothetical protein
MCVLGWVFPLNPGLSCWRGLGGALCIPVGSALYTPIPQDTHSVGPHWQDPEEDVSWLHLWHGVWLESLCPSFDDGRVLDLRCLCPLAAPTFRLLGVLVGGGGSLNPEEDTSGWRLPHRIWPETSHPLWGAL